MLLRIVADPVGDVATGGQGVGVVRVEDPHQVELSEWV